jgi:tetratricopeptide (TPR) repeat protein
VNQGRLRFSAALLLAGACLLVYANGLTGGFTYDDKAIVRDNPRIRAPGRIDQVFGTQYFGGPPGSGTAYRPMLLLSFALQWWLHGGNAVPFHVANVFLHIVATLLFVMLLLRIGIPSPAAIAAGLLFAVHPIHVEAVTSVVGRGETQAAALVLGYLLLGLRGLAGGGRWWLALSLVLYFLALLSKESAAVAPALLFLCLVWKAEGNLPSRFRQALWRGLAVYVGSGVVLLFVLRARAWVLGGPIKSAETGIFELENPLAPLAPLTRAINACVIFFRYLGRLAFPLRLSSDESAWSIRLVTPHDLLGWLASLLIVALAVAAVLGLRQRMPAAFGFLFLCVAFLPSSNLVFPTGTIFAERLAYLPSAGFCLVAASWLIGAGDELAASSRRRVWLLAALAILLAARAIVRNPVWASDEALFTNMVWVSPESAKAHYDFAYMSGEIGNPRRALLHYTRATQIYATYWDAWAGRGRMERTLGHAEAAAKAYAESIRIAPKYDNGYFGLGLAREDLGDKKGAEEAYRKGLRANPRSLPLAYRFALLLTAEKARAAPHAWLWALAIEPTSLPARLGYAAWLRDAGRGDEALRQVEEVLRRSPRYAPALELRKEINGRARPAG